MALQNSRLEMTFDGLWKWQFCHGLNEVAHVQKNSLLEGLSYPMAAASWV